MSALGKRRTANLETTPNDHGAAARLAAVVALAELRDIRLLRSESAFEPAQLSESAEYELALPPAKFRARFVQDHRVLFCEVKLRAELVSQGESGPQSVAKVDAEYGLVYVLGGDVGVDNATADLFAARNATFNAWPFFRELSFSLISRMGLPPTLLPLFKLPTLALHGK